MLCVMCMHEYDIIHYINKIFIRNLITLSVLYVGTIINT